MSASNVKILFQNGLKVVSMKLRVLIFAWIFLIKFSAFSVDLLKRETLLDIFPSQNMDLPQT